MIVLRLNVFSKKDSKGLGWLGKKIYEEKRDKFAKRLLDDYRETQEQERLLDNISNAFQAVGGSPLKQGVDSIDRTIEVAPGIFKRIHAVPEPGENYKDFFRNKVYPQYQDLGREKELLKRPILEKSKKIKKNLGRSAKIAAGAAIIGYGGYRGYKALKNRKDKKELLKENKNDSKD